MLGTGVATASGNSVIVDGGGAGYVTGGQAGSDGPAVASNNTVTIHGGTIHQIIRGGLASGSGSNTATNNTVTIHGAPIFGGQAALYGGEVGGGGTSAGNTLNLHSAGLSVEELRFFQRLNFFLPDTLADFFLPEGLMVGDTMLTVIGRRGDYPGQRFGGIVDLTGVTVNVGLEGAGPTIRSGSRFVLIAAREMSGDFQPMTGTLGGHSYTVAQEGNSLVLNID
jgi:hypothetical protein